MASSKKIPRGAAKSLSQAAHQFKQRLNNSYGIGGYMGKMTYSTPSIYPVDSAVANEFETKFCRLKPTKTLFQQIKKIFKSKDKNIYEIDSIFRVFEFSEAEIFELFKSINVSNKYSYNFRSALAFFINDKQYLEEYINKYMDIYFAWETREDNSLKCEEETESTTKKEEVTLRDVLDNISYHNEINSFISGTIERFEPNYSKLESFLPIYEKVTTIVEKRIRDDIDAQVSKYFPKLDEKDKIFVEYRKKHIIERIFRSSMGHLLNGNILDEIDEEFIKKYHNRMNISLLYKLYKKNGMNPLVNDTIKTFIIIRMKKRIKETIGPAADFMTINISWDDTVIQLFENVDDEHYDEDRLAPWEDYAEEDDFI